MILRKAKLSDSLHIAELNNKFYLAYIDGNKEKGFLKNEFSIEEIEILINADEIVVAECENIVIGYYLTNSIIETKTIKRRKDIVKILIADGKLENGKYVFLTQAVVDKPFMGKGVAKKLLLVLKEQVKDKFDYLIGYIDSENLNAKEAHLKSGWIIFTDIENGYLAYTKVN